MDHPKHTEVTEATAAAEATMAPQRVPVNVYETGDALVIVAPIPAVMPGDVSIRVAPGLVTISTQLRSAAPKDYLVQEWEYGGYERSVELPPGFGSAAEASLANGQLAVRVLRGEPTEEFEIAPT
ncbi:hypothetical protein BH18ACT4_BH18ACT4_08710 [soil metagenome]